MFKQNHRVTRLIVLFGLGVILAGSVLFRDAALKLSGPTSPDIPLYGQALIGDFNHKITTTSPEAQAYFNQGFQLRYAFAKPEAVRSFRAAQQADSSCSMCYWGEAWALGGYLNEPMTPQEAPKAYSAIQKAASLAQTATLAEQAIIEAMSLRYSSVFDPETQLDREAAYAEAMEEVAQRYPEDLDAVTLYGESLFLLEPRRGKRDLTAPTVQKLLSVLESVLAKNIRHGGACHLYIHVTEATAEPERAEACAEYISDAIPGVSHINHMPSHTWNEVGRWGDSVEANQHALRTDAKASQGNGLAVYHGHNLQMLLYTASMDGQSTIAFQAAQDYAVKSGDISFQLLTLLRFGKFDEILAITSRPEAEMAGGLWDFAQGYSRLRTGNLELAQQHLKQLQAIASSAQTVFRQSPVKDLLTIVGGILEGEIQQDMGNGEGAIAAQTAAVQVEDQLVYDEPEQLPFSVRHWLGANLLSAKRYPEAEQVYREELIDHPSNGWSLMGLKQALLAQQKPTSEVEQELQQSWARADVELEASRF